MSPQDRDQVLKQLVNALSAMGDDALTKAAAEGIPERDDVIAWLADVWPEGCSAVDGEGDLVLQIAARCGASASTVRLLLGECCCCLRVRGRVLRD